ncbi:MAG: RNase H-like domain-containing protein, partial [Bacilli bacterium]
QLSGSTVFSQIDLNMGYYQIAMHPRDIEKTGFTICNQQYEFLKMPFGLSNAPRTFQRAIYTLFEDSNFVKVYLDDILVHSKTKEDHLSHLKHVFKKLNQINASINYEKSKFNVLSVNYLGNIISKNGIKADTSRLWSIEKLIPKNKKQLMKTLGFINWFRPYIKNLIEKTCNLNNKLKKDTKFNWTLEDQNKLDEIMSNIKENVLLNYPALEKQFVIETDASDYAIGAVLSQENKTIIMFSAKLSGSELNYTTVEKETFAIIKAIEHFKSIIFNSSIMIKTDNANLIFKGELTKRIQRWKYQLEEFDYKLEYKRGKENVLADSLSRLFNVREEGGIKLIDLREISRHQKESITLTKDIEKIKFKTMQLENNEILFDGNNRIIIPREFSTYWLKKIHEKLIHPGRRQLGNTLNKYFLIKSYQKIINEISNNCKTCNENKKLRTNYGSLTGGILSNQPLEIISSDIFGPIKLKHFKTNKIEQYFYIVTFTDIFSRWTEIATIFDIKSNTIVKALIEKWIQHFGPPIKILSDQGRQYISSNFKNILNRYGIKQYITTSHNPTGNSISERINKTIAEVCRMSRG